MYKNTIKSAIKPKRLNHDQEIALAKKELIKDIDFLVSKKTELGYQGLSWNEFLAINPLTCTNVKTQSDIVDIQVLYNEYLDRQNMVWSEDSVVEEFNKLHAIIRVEQTYILTEKHNALGDHDFSLESRQSFKMYYEDERVMCFDGVERSKADIWLRSAQRRKYKGIVFEPTNTCGDDYYNLWKGFAKSPVPGKCEKYWSHLKENICSDNEEAYTYLRRWLAYIFQYPNKIHTALVLCGSQGVGKNKLVDPLGVLLGSHFAPLSSMAELVSNFNYHLKNAVLIHANEALWGGNKKDLGTVKAMITEDVCLIEGKGKDRIKVKNFKHIILSSNEEWPVHLDIDDRRFFVIRVSEKHKEDHTYFAELDQELQEGGYEALLHDLLHEKLEGFNPRSIPDSPEAFSIKLRSADSSYRYLYEALCYGSFSVSKSSENEFPVWQGPIPKDMVYSDYRDWCQNNTEQAVSNGQFGKTLKKLISSIKDARPGSTLRTRCYEFPNLRQAQKDFSDAFKEKPERLFDNYYDETD